MVPTYNVVDLTDSDDENLIDKVVHKVEDVHDGADALPEKEKITKRNQCLIVNMVVE